MRDCQKRCNSATVKRINLELKGNEKRNNQFTKTQYLHATTTITTTLTPATTITTAATTTITSKTTVSEASTI